MGQPSILFVGSYLPGTRATRGVSAELADRLQARGWRVALTSAKVPRAARLLDSLATIVGSRDRFDVAHVDVYSGPAFAYAEAACAALTMLRKPFVLTLHGGRLPEFAARSPRRVRSLLRRAHAVTAPSLYLGTKLAAFRDAIELLPNGLDVEAYRFRVRAPPAPRLLWLRAFHHIYNPGLAVEVLARLSLECPDASLTMVGPDKGDGSLAATRALAMEAGVDGRVHIVGAVHKREVPAWLDRGDIFLNTTTVDNTPVSVIEAMAAGLPVVTTDVGGLRYLAADGDEALLVPSGDAGAMTAAVMRLLTDPKLAGRLSRAGRGKAETADWGALIDRWEALLGRVAREAR